MGQEHHHGAGSGISEKEPLRGVKEVESCGGRSSSLRMVGVSCVQLSCHMVADTAFVILP